jgi:hypothetical protein
MSWEAKLVLDVAGKVFFWDQRVVMTAAAGCGVDSWSLVASGRQKTRIPGLSGCHTVLSADANHMNKCTQLTEGCLGDSDVDSPNMVVPQASARTEWWELSW